LPLSTNTDAPPADFASPAVAAQNNPLLLRDGTLLCPSSVEGRRVGQPGARLEELWTAAVDATRDGGRTWSHHGPIAMDGVAVIQVRVPHRILRGRL
jgi:hypothetical protein